MPSSIADLLNPVPNNGDVHLPSISSLTSTPTTPLSAALNNASHRHILEFLNRICQENPEVKTLAEKELLVNSGEKYVPVTPVQFRAFHFAWDVDAS